MCTNAQESMCKRECDLKREWERERECVYDCVRVCIVKIATAAGEERREKKAKEEIHFNVNLDKATDYGCKKKKNKKKKGKQNCFVR